MVVPNNHGFHGFFLLKMIILGCFGGNNHHLRKHPDGGNLKIFGIFTPKIWENDSQFDVCIFFKGVGEKPPTRF